MTRPEDCRRQIDLLMREYEYLRAEVLQQLAINPFAAGSLGIGLVILAGLVDTERDAVSWVALGIGALIAIAGFVIRARGRHRDLRRLATHLYHLERRINALAIGGYAAEEDVLTWEIKMRTELGLPL